MHICAGGGGAARPVGMRASSGPCAIIVDYDDTCTERDTIGTLLSAAVDAQCHVAGLQADWMVNIFNNDAQGGNCLQVQGEQLPPCPTLSLSQQLPPAQQPPSCCSLSSKQQLPACRSHRQVGQLS
eukprot:1157218-Pelagomonas_calceolata.AAC.6